MKLPEGQDADPLSGRQPAVNLEAGYLHDPQHPGNKSSAPKHAVLLAAGRGVRLRPLTDHTPKPLLEVDGTITLDWVLRSARRAGIEHACLVTHHLEEQIRRYAGDGSLWGLQVVYAHQTGLLGTAHALRCVVEQLPGFLPEAAPFLLSATDYALPEDYLTRLVDDHLESDADITMSLKEVSAEELASRSSVVLGDGWQVLGVVEKPSLGEDFRLEQSLSPYAASLTLILPPEALAYLDALMPTSRGEFEWAELVNNMIADGYIARGCLLPAPPEFELK